MEAALFIIFGAVSLAGAIAMVTAKNPVYAALGLMATLFSLAVFYIVNLAHLVAAVQVIVYAGAVMTLFLFVIMLIGVDRAEDTSETLRFQRPLVFIVGAAAVGLGVAAVVADEWSWTPLAPAGAEAPNGTMAAVAEQLFSVWALPFEAVSLLLIVASIGAIALAFFAPVRRRKEKSDA